MNKLLIRRGRLMWLVFDGDQIVHAEKRWCDAWVWANGETLLRRLANSFEEAS